MAGARLSAQEAAFVYGEDARIPLHIGCLCLLDAAPLRCRRGTLDLTRMRAAFAARLHRFPLFRKRLAEVPFQAGRPVWVDAPRFRIEDHLRLEVLPEPGGRRELLDLVGRFQGVPLSRERPLWELMAVDGLGDGSHVALVAKVHHAIADGVAGVSIAKLLFDLEPRPAADPAPAWKPAPEPGGTRLWLDAWSSHAGDLLRNARSLGGALADPRRPARSLYKAARAVGTLAPALDRLPWNARVGGRRAVETLSLPLPELLAARRAFGVKLNDVVLAAVAGALRRHLATLGMDPDELLRVRALCPVDVRAPDDAGPGSRVSAMFVDLPVDEPDPRLRVERVAERSRSLKVLDVAEGANLWHRAASLLPPPLLRASSRFQFRGLMGHASLLVSNVRGPAAPLYCLGARLRAFYPYFGVQDGLGLNVVFFSYAGSFFAGVTADPDLATGLPEFAESLRKALGELASAA
jgi:WS/DGAT/MGAT family acyltransferase